jgi:hypothetical protein
MRWSFFHYLFEFSDTLLRLLYLAAPDMTRRYPENPVGAHRTSR